MFNIYIFKPVFLSSFQEKQGYEIRNGLNCFSEIGEALWNAKRSASLFLLEFQGHRGSGWSCPVSHSAGVQSKSHFSLLSASSAWGNSMCVSLEQLQNPSAIILGNIINVGRPFLTHFPTKGDLCWFFLLCFWLILCKANQVLQVNF